MNRISIVLISLFCVSCTPQAQKKSNGNTYFDVAQYFGSEVARLAKSNPTIQKEVTVAGEKEQKTLQISDWKTELAMFSNSAINKESWREEFTIDSTKNTTTYTTANSKIPIKQIEVIRSDDKINGIIIYRLNENNLYRSTDTLRYYPDSNYSIKSYQKIKMLEAKEYYVIGTFLK